MKTYNSIAIITPIYHGTQYIDRLIQMIDTSTKQLHRQHETVSVEYVFVIDSPDDWVDEQKEEQLIHSTDNIRVRFIVNSKNSGIHQSRVNGLHVSDSEFVYFLDQDDEIAPEFLLSQYDCIGRADVIVANGCRKNDQRVISRLYSRYLAQSLVRHPFMYIYGTDMIFSPGQCLIRRDAIPALWYANTMRVNGCDDFLLWLLMMNEKCNFTVNRRVLYSHVETMDNYSSSSEHMTESYMEMCDILEENASLKKSSIRVLRRRYQLKNNVKNSKNVWIKIWKIVSNVDISLITMLYKICGYH